MKLLILAMFASSLWAQSSHSYVNTNRSSVITHYYVGVGIEGEVGSFVKKSKENGKSVVGSDVSWQGYGVKNTLGFEMVKFLQFEVAHTSLKMKNQHDESLVGSRFQGGANLTFAGPLGNIVFGGGASVLRLDYTHLEDSADVVGTGTYYTIGYNYFLNSTVSFSSSLRQLDEHLLRNSGTENLEGFETKTTAVGLGFNIWI